MLMKPAVRPFWVIAMLQVSMVSAFACTGCGCKGGPGYRLPSGKCVSWAQHQTHQTVGDFPVGAHCEQPQGCRLETAKGVKLLDNGASK